VLLSHLIFTNTSSTSVTTPSTPQRLDTSYEIPRYWRHVSCQLLKAVCFAGF